jgi:transposase
MRNKNTKNYDLEFKQSSAKLAVESDRPITETARNLGVNENTLRGWVKKYCHIVKKPSSHSELEQLSHENAQLRKEISRLKQERDILKKASAYFASNLT